ncbi:exodeoxyribonuclease V subunit beta [Desulfobacterium sp. N47]|uniref:DNA 3'-5' helicase n=1 Tax=uncultured Desulfobacterium sp. TaxID=201089 RepID=E1YC47_9BACT|nr:hypothetical protein N47_G34650 [uncultured Desulfobacterium sp.]
MMKQFDLINAPLYGTNLIEAGAGTGKTYTIESLFLRLIIENKLTIDQILVVTFTKAATEKLKERIRSKLAKAKEAFSEGLKDKRPDDTLSEDALPKDALIDALCEKYENHTLAYDLINNALINFNEAAIFTIHGFCARILSDYSFETGNLFDTELVTDQTDLVQEIAEDFWRINFYRAEPEFINYCLTKISGPDYFSRLVSKQVSSRIIIIPEIEKPQLESLTDYRSIINEIKNEWLTSTDEIRALLLNPALKGNIYGTVEPLENGMSKREIKIHSMFFEMDNFLDDRHAGFPIFDKFENFCSEKIGKSTKSKQKIPSHKFFNLCDQLLAKSIEVKAQFDRYIIYLKKTFINYADDKLVKRKQSKNIQYYDDLLTKVKDALLSPDGNDLAVLIRLKYKAALIDEFQDTDPVQYEIFSGLFDSKDSVLFIIGDPKQAIYSFRGADIFSYIKAAKSVDNKNTLIENWRSSPGLIDAVNAIFSGIKYPFVFEEISFINGVSGHKENYGRENETSLSCAPLTLWHLFSDDFIIKNKPVTKNNAQKIICESVASEILRLLTSSKNDAGKSIKQSDIAILVRTNTQARMVKKSLSKRRIHSVIYSIDNVFSSDEATELGRVLAAASDPSNERKIKAAIVTDIFGVSGEEIDSFKNNPLLPEKWQSLFIECHRLWNKYGFIEMFGYFMKKERVKERLALFHDGERRITNLLHLCEILHKVSIEKTPGINGLIRWFAEQRDVLRQNEEEHLLRLETDNDAVKIVTIHKSKGLEFRVVFCPFNWHGSEIRDEEVLFHDQSGGRNLILDLEKNESSRSIAGKELLSENLRLLYVALTRAKEKCYLVWGRINTAETSPMAYLLHYARNNEYDGDKDIINAVKDYFKSQDTDVLLNDLDKLEKRAGGTIDICVIPPPGTGIYYPLQKSTEQCFARNFTGKIDDTFRISSYSSLVASSFAGHDSKDVDAGLRSYLTDFSQEQSISEQTGIFSFPKGARSGTFFHDLFEHMSFLDSDSETRQKLVDDKLTEYGFGAKWKDSVCSMINKVLEAGLNAYTGSASEEMTIKLSEVSMKQRVNEMEFYFPLKMITPQTIKKIFYDYGNIKINNDYPAWIENLSFSPSQGFMKGYIDMVFYAKNKVFFVDWKSNHLGNNYENYEKTSLIEEMDKESYILQYHLYLLALHQYMRLKYTDYNYNNSFGGVFYIFIRGVDDLSAPGSGIYYDMPDISLIDALGKAMVPGY